jgi:hypothetical protein
MSAHSIDIAPDVIATAAGCGPGSLNRGFNWIQEYPFNR